MPPIPADDQMPDGMDAALGDMNAPEQEAPSPAIEEESEAHIALIRRFEKENKFPEDVKIVYDEFDSIREYVHTQAMVPKTRGAVAENLVLRNQQIRLSQVWAKNPDLTVDPKKLLPPDPLPVNPNDPISIEAANMADSEWKNHLDTLTKFGKTGEFLVKHFFDRADGTKIIDGGVQDVQTDGLWWVKLTWQENMGRDPLGVHRANDFQDTVTRLSTLAAEFEQGVFQEDDARHAELLDLSNSVMEQVKGEQWTQNYASTQGSDPATGLPTQEKVDPRELAWQSGERATCQGIAELPRDRCFRIDPVDPTDIRRDWYIKRPEEWRKSSYVSHRLFMLPNEVKDEFGLTQKDLEEYFRGSGVIYPSDEPYNTGSLEGGNIRENPADRKEVEKAHRAGAMAVWERWDRVANRRYVWIEGCDKFLVNEVPAVVSKYWYPFFLLYWNRVTGRFEPVSDAKLQKPLNEEYNLLRTQDRQARKAAFNKYIIAKNAMSEEEKTKLENCPPEGVIEVKRANDVRKYLQVVVGSNYKPELYDTGKVRSAMDEAASIPSSARGNTASTKFATSDQIANQVMNEQSDRYRGAVETFCKELFEAMFDMLVQVLPEANAKAIAGPGATWPMIDRESLWSNLQLSIDAGSSGKPDQQRKLALYEQMAGIMQSLGIGGPTSPDDINGVQIFKDLLETMNIKTDPERYLIPKPPMMAAPMPGAPPGGKEKKATPPGGPQQGPPMGEPAGVAGGKVPMPSPPPGSVQR